MQFPSLASLADLLLLNLVAASILLCSTAIIVAFLVRRTSLSLQHGLLCVVLVLTLASPLPIWIATNQGFGIVPVSLAGSDRETPDNFDATEQIAGEAGVSFQMPESLNKSQAVENAEGKSLPSTHDLMTQVAKPGTGSAAAAGLWPSQLSVILVAVWAAIALWLSLRLLRGLHMIRQLRRSLRPTNDPRLIAAVARIATIREGCMDICESHLAPSPLTFGWWRSVIVMPVGLADLFDDEELECVLAHEAAHVARHDTTIAALQQLCAIGFWWNPLVHAVNRQLSRLREQICDDAVVKCYGDGLPLARALVRVAEWSSRCEVTVPLASTLLDDKDELENRINRLADRTRLVSVGLSAWSASFVAMFGIVLAAVLLVPVMRAQVLVTPRAATASTQQDLGRVDIQELVKAWSKRQDGFNTVRIHWTEERLLPKGALAGIDLINGVTRMLPGLDKEARFTLWHSIVFGADGRTRYAKKGNLWNANLGCVANQYFYSIHNPTRTIDFSSKPIPEEDELNIEEPRPATGFLDKPKSFFADNIRYYYAAHMIFRPMELLDASKLSLAESSESVDGTECQILIYQSTERVKIYIYVDPRRDYLPVKRVSKLDGKTRSTLNVDYELSDNRWLPTSWSLTAFDPESGSVREVAESTVRLMTVNQEVDASRFEFEFPEGTRVTDRTGDRPNTFIVQKDE